MTDYVELALKYGGYTSLDRVYLTHLLAGLDEKDRLSVITPPPSVINAYFAELYQRKSPEAATAYFQELSQALSLFTDQPSFDEVTPFIRLNLSGQSYGFVYEKADLAQVFAEKEASITPELLFEIAAIFPHYQVFAEEGKIYLVPAEEEKVESTESLTALTDLVRLADGSIKLMGYSQDELVELSANYSGKCSYRSENRTAMIYIT